MEERANLKSTDVEAANPVEAASTAPDDEKAKKNRLPEIPVPNKAVVTCREDLDQVLAAHQAWIDAVLNPNVEVAVGRANLSGADLRGYDLSQVNLSGADLRGANLESVNLEGANLTVANLQNAVLACANLKGAKLTRAKLEGADLRGADLGHATLGGVDLSKCRMRTPDALENPVRTLAGATRVDPGEDNATAPVPAENTCGPQANSSHAETQSPIALDAKEQGHSL